MKLSTKIVLSIVIVILAISAIVILFSSMHSKPVGQIALSVIAMGAGSLIAIVSALVLIVRVLEGHTIEKLIAATFPLLAGALIASQHWVFAVSLTVLGIVYIFACSAFRQRTEFPVEDAPQLNAIQP